MCLLDEVRAGVEPEVRDHKGKAAVFGLSERQPLAVRKHRDKAEQLIQDAREEVARGADQVPPEELERRRHTRVITPQRAKGEPAHYEVIEAEDLIASHNPHTFDPDSRYPEGVQEREYKSQQEEQKKVVMGGQNLDPALLLTDSPTPVDGPPLVTGGARHIVLGGNGRSMMLLRAYGVRAGNPDCAPCSALTSAESAAQTASTAADRAETTARQQFTPEAFELAAAAHQNAFALNREAARLAALSEPAGSLKPARYSMEWQRHQSAARLAQGTARKLRDDPEGFRRAVRR